MGTNVSKGQQPITISIEETPFVRLQSANTVHRETSDNNIDDYKLSSMSHSLLHWLS